MGTDKDARGSRGDDCSDQLLQRVNTRTRPLRASPLRLTVASTTGLPKGVEISHFNLVSNTEQLIFKRSQVAGSNFGLERFARLQESGERWLAALPMYHAFVGAAHCHSDSVFIVKSANPCLQNIGSNLLRNGGASNRSQGLHHGQV